MEIINGVESTSSYIYDDDNRISVVTNGEVAIYYHYDSLGRVDYREITQDDVFVFFEYFYYSAAPSDDPDLSGTSAQISSYRILVGGYNFTYTYDNNGNILSISDGTYTTSYVYDSANQLIRENNQAGNYTHTWTYDQAGNILSRKEYAYTTGTLGTPTDTVTYTYGDEQWRDLLTAYDGNTITYDNVGNPLSDGEWTYTWENGRQLASMTNGSTTWTYTYNADGMRISKTNGSTAYSYVYNGSKLSQMTVGNNTLTFTYDASGKPVTVTYNGTTYFYATSIQGDVFAIMDANAHTVVTYSYDAWGNLLSLTGDMANTLGALNPLRYRGYVYDTETGLYYLQSRYYNPEIGRFLNADAFVTTGQGFAGNNMFAYCLNNPVNMTDNSGTWPSWNDIKAGFKKAVDWVDDNIIQPVVGFVEDVVEDFNNYDSDNQSEEKVLESNYFSSYKGVPVVRTNGDRSGSFGAIFLTRETNNRRNPEDVLRHEYGHTKQLEQLGVVSFALCIGLPSWQQWGTGEYYSKPWEITADIYGGVQSRNHSQSNIDRGFAYLEGSKRIVRFIGMLIGR